MGELKNKPLFLVLFSPFVKQELAFLLRDEIISPGQRLEIDQGMRSRDVRVSSGCTSFAS